MKLSYNWLKDYIDLKGISAEDVDKALTMSGSEIEAIEEMSNDKVMELEITSNRPDCLSILGLAREVSAVLDKELKTPIFALDQRIEKDETVKMDCIIEDKELCSQYTARVISGVTVKESIPDIKNKIEAIGIRSVNNIVDITNFCLMELGQPMHAFDLDKIKGKKIVVRKARKGEKIVTIDEIERELDPEMLIICDSEKPIAIAGVMGGRETEVTTSTKNILLESAYFDPMSIRRTARKLVLSSDSSYRFERHVDKGMIIPASERATNLIVAVSGGKIGNFCEDEDLSIDPINLSLDCKRVTQILGIDIEEKEIVRILEKLEIRVEKRADILELSIPSFREDLLREVDIIEEIGRVYGYEKIPAAISKITVQVTRKEKSRQVVEKTRESLAAFGMNEIMTYSLIGGTAVKRFDAISNNIVELTNPLSEEQRFLTPQLLDGMLKSMAHNINRNNRDLKLFEIGTIYSEKAKGYNEEETLCLAVTGTFSDNWQNGSKQSSFYDLKGLVDGLCAVLEVDVTIEEASNEYCTTCAAVKIDNEEIGFIGEISKKALKDYDIEQSVFVCQIKLGKIINKANLMVQHKAVPRFPISVRDISVLCEKTLPAGEITSLILGKKEELVRKVEFIDLYVGDKLPSDKKSLTYRIHYGLEERTITDEEIETVHFKIKETLSSKLNISFR